MEQHSRIPAPLAVHLSSATAVTFTAHFHDRVEDLSAHLADLVLLGVMLGAPDGDAACPAPGTSGPQVGATSDDQRLVGRWQLDGEVTATVLAGDGAYALDADSVGPLAAAGLLRALADATADSLP